MVTSGCFYCQFFSYPFPEFGIKINRSAGAGARGRCRISSPRFLAECRKKRLGVPRRQPHRR